MTKQQLAIKGVIFASALVLFVIANIRVVYCINRERDRESYFYMGISLALGIIMCHLSKHFV